MSDISVKCEFFHNGNDNENENENITVFGYPCGYPYSWPHGWYVRPVSRFFTSSELKTIVKWCENNLEDSWALYSGVLYISNDSDLVLFKLCSKW